MAAELGADNAGEWAAVQCDARGCYASVAVRSLRGPFLPVVALETAFDMAEAGGWVLAGRAWCPRHVHKAPGRLRTLGDGYAWLDVVKGAR